MGVEARRRHQRVRRDRVTRSRSGLRVVDSDEAICSALVLAGEYDAWAVELAKREYGIDARAESEQGLSTSSDEFSSRVRASISSNEKASRSGWEA